MGESRTDGVMIQQDPQDRCSEEDTINNHYKILKTLGTGNFAQVKLALHLRTEVPVALKKLEKDKTNSTIIGNELEIMKFLDHPNIIKLFHVLETTEHIYLVLEYVSGGDLASHILEVDHIPEVEAQHIFTQLTCAVKYCHENDIAHRDIKPENILMDAMKNVKLCDFGLAVNVSAEPESTVFCGTLPYCAPELFSSQGYDARALDIWSMGVVLYIMVTKHYPFLATTYDQMKIKMQKPHCYIPPKLPVHIASLIIKLLTTDPEQRPKIQDIMQYPWLKGSEEFSKSTLSLEPLPNKPNPRIMAAMLGLGYSLKDIGDSLYENNFNSVMETYLILKYQSPFMDNSNHKENFTLPNIAMAPADPTTCHSFLKSIGSEPDNSTSTVPANYPSQNNKIVKKETKNHSMPSIHCCQQKSEPHSTGVQCGPLKHDHEQILSSSLKKRRRVSKSVSGGPFQHGHEHLLSNRASKSVSGGPFQHGHEHLLSNRASKSVSGGPFQHGHEHLLSNRASKSVSGGPFQHGHEHLLSNRASKSVSGGPFQHGHEHLLSNRASKSVSGGPFQHGHEHLLSNRASKSVSGGPFQHGHEHLLSNRASKSVSCAPFQHGHEHLLSNRASKSVSCAPFQHGHEHLLSNRASKSVSGGPFQHGHEHLLSNRASKSVSGGPFQHGHEHLLSNRASKSVSGGPFQHGHEHLLSNRASKSVSGGPFQHGHEHLLSNRASKSVSGGPFQHGHEHLLSNRASKSVSCGPVQHNQDEHLLSITLQKRGRASKSEFCGPVQHDLEQHLDILSEDHITQVEAQDENPHKSSSFLQHTPSSRSSKEGFEDVTTTDAHQHKSLTPQEISEPNLTSAQPQRVTIASPRRWGGWKQVKRRLVKGLRRLCCCLPAEERRCTFQRRVAPQEGGHNGVT